MAHLVRTTSQSGLVSIATALQGGTRFALRRDALLLNDADQARESAQSLVTRGYRGLAFERLLTGSSNDVAERATELAAPWCRRHHRAMRIA